jgi:hypothetical protein
MTGPGSPVPAEAVIRKKRDGRTLDAADIIAGTANGAEGEKHG